MGNRKTCLRAADVDNTVGLYSYLRDVLKYYLAEYLSDDEKYFLRFVCKEWYHHFRPLTIKEKAIFFLKYGYWKQYKKLQKKYHLIEDCEILEALAHGGFFVPYFDLAMALRLKVKKSQLEGTKFLDSSHTAVANAATRGHLYFLQQTRYHKDSRICTFAARNNKLHVLEYALNEGYPWEDEVAIRMVFQQNTKMLELMRKTKSIDFALYEAVMQGKIKVLKWALKHNLLWHIIIPELQVKKIPHDTLLWLHDNKV